MFHCQSVSGEYPGAKKVVAPAFLNSAEIRKWLNGVEPAWTMLTSDSFHALQHEPSLTNSAI